MLKLLLLKDRFDGIKGLYCPTLRAEYKPFVAKCFPAVMFNRDFSVVDYKMIVDEQVGEYDDEFNRHPDKGIIYANLGGREEVERQLRKLWEDYKAE